MRGSVEEKFGVEELHKQHTKGLHSKEIKRGASL